MWGGDSSGQRVSLLNDAIPTTTINRFPRPKLPDRSKDSNYSSSPSITSSKGSCTCSSRSSISRSPGHSPPTPPISRLNSFTSLSTVSTKSPMTPNYGFDPMDQPLNKNATLPYYSNFNRPQAYPSAQDAQAQNPYYNIPGQQPLPPLNPLDLDGPYSQQHVLHRLQTQQIPFTSDTPLHQLSPTSSNQAHMSAILPTSTKTAHNHVNSMQPPQKANSSTAPIKPSPNSSTPAKASAAPPTPAKKKYPCPHAQTFNCADTFTTSGHAARHGKKHTGEKNVHCPTCGKAFTRKDNMKQHERTHKGSTGSRTGSASPALGSTKGQRSRRASDVVGDAMDMDSPRTTAVAAQPSLASKKERPKMQRSELSEILENVSAGVTTSTGLETGGRSLSEDLDADGEGESPGLDALAMAAGAAG
ncbi:MAG: hypothetical protein Q9217_006821 [Psora testacea]